MRHRSPFAFAGVLLILLLAVMGFAAFSATPTDTARTTSGIVLPPTASGRIAGSVIGAQLATSVTPVPTTPNAEASDESAAESVSADVATSEPSTTAVDSSLAATTTQATTTLPPTTTTTAPTTTTTTAAPTTTTAAPTTTTAPPTTTTLPPTTTTAPPDPTAPPVEHLPAVEQWRDVVAAYWPAELVDDALSVIECESNGDPNAVNPTSGASGLFQFLPSTWENAAPQAGWAGADVLDAEANVATAYWLFAQYDDPWAAWSCKP